MPISWTTALMDQDRTLEGALARRKLAQDQMFRSLVEAENQRATRTQEEHQRNVLGENTRLREAQQAETARRNAEVADDREIAQYMSAIGMLEPGAPVADPKLLEFANRRGLGALFETGEGGSKFKGTAAQLAAKARLEDADKARALAEEREARMARATEANMRLQNAQLDNQLRRTAIQEAREKRLAQAQQNVTKLTPQQQIAFRAVLKAKQDKASEQSGGLFGTGLFADETDPLDLVEQAYKEVTGSAILSPAPPPAPDAKGQGTGKGNNPASPAPAPAPKVEPRVIAPGISVTRRQ